MITVSRIFIRAKETLLSITDLQEIGENAYQATETAANEVLGLDGLGSRVEVSEGSTEIVAIILGSAGAVIAAIGGYDSFFSGLDRIRAQARQAGDFVRHRLKKDSHLERSRITSSRVTTGQLTSLERLHRRVRERRLSADDAVQKALRILRDGNEIPDADLIRSLEVGFQAPKHGLSRVDRLDQYAGEANDAYRSVPVERRVLPGRAAHKRKVVIERLPDSQRKTISNEE